MHVTATNVMRTRFEIEQDIEFLKDNLDGKKTYWYKEEVQRDCRTLERLKQELKELDEKEVTG